METDFHTSQQYIKGTENEKLFIFSNFPFSDVFSLLVFLCAFMFPKQIYSVRSLVSTITSQLISLPLLLPAFRRLHLRVFKWKTLIAVAKKNSTINFTKSLNFNLLFSMFHSLAAPTSTLLLRKRTGLVIFSWNHLFKLSICFKFRI